MADAYEQCIPDLQERNVARQLGVALGKGYGLNLTVGQLAELAKKVVRVSKYEEDAYYCPFM